MTKTDPQPVADRDLDCAQCGAKTVATTWTDDALVWGSGDSAATLTVHIPYRSCSSCGCTYLDHEAEDIRHNAVCRHLGVKDPDELRRFGNRK